MEEREVVKAVARWLEREGFRVFEEFLIDESGRPADRKRPDLATPEKHVMAWLNAHPQGIALADIQEGLKGQVPPDRVREAADHLVKMWEVSVKQGKLYPGPVLHTGSFVNPCPVRPDLYGIRGEDRVERWAVECKGSRGDIAHGIGQARLNTRVSDRSLLAIPSDWPSIYEGKGKEQPWTVLRGVAKDLGFDLLRVAENGAVHTT